MPETPATKEFNEKVAELIKNATPADVVGVLRDENSILRAHQNNQNQNNRKGDDTQ